MLCFQRGKGTCCHNDSAVWLKAALSTLDVEEFLSPNVGSKASLHQILPFTLPDEVIWALPPAFLALSE
jgi:hypothetical protein